MGSGLSCINSKANKDAKNYFLRPRVEPHCVVPGHCEPRHRPKIEIQTPEGINYDFEDFKTNYSTEFNPRPFYNEVMKSSTDSKEAPSLYFESMEIDIPHHIAFIPSRLSNNRAARLFNSETFYHPTCTY